MKLWEDSLFVDALKLEKLYRSCVREAFGSIRLTPNEIDVLLFLSCNAPHHDTATDIAAARGISKALVARSVDCLHRRGFLEGERDEHDRRIIHLRLCGEGIEIAEQLQQKCGQVASQLQQGIPAEELKAVHAIIKKMRRNLDTVLQNTERQVK